MHSIMLFIFFNYLIFNYIKFCFKIKVLCMHNIFIFENGHIV